MSYSDIGANKILWLKVTNECLGNGANRILSRTQNYKNNYLFTGKEKDEESDLQYFEARYYSPTNGRFYSQDRVFWEIGQTKGGQEVLFDPQQINAYSYARNNPIVYNDPTGEKIEFRARPLANPVLGMVYSHSYIYIEIEDQHGYSSNYKGITIDNKPITFGGYKDGDSLFEDNPLKVYMNNPGDRGFEDGRVTIDPAVYGMTEMEMVHKIIDSYQKLDSQKITYDKFGDNCHSVSTTILNDAGVPLDKIKEFQSKGSTPSLGTRVTTDPNAPVIPPPTQRTKLSGPMSKIKTDTNKQPKNK